MSQAVDLSLVLPFYNEEKNVEWVLKEILESFGRQPFKYELIAVDNGSRDGTASLIDGFVRDHPDLIKKATVTVNEGYGWGIREGLKLASGRYVGYAPGDGQVSPEDIAQVFRKAMDLDLDFVQGKRIRKDSLFRRVNTTVYNFVFHLFFRCEVYDIGSNPKIMRKEWFEKIGLVSKDWFIDGEIALKTHTLGGKMKEFPVTFRKREKGSSKINILSVFEMLKNVMLWKVRVFQGRIGKPQPPHPTEAVPGNDGSSRDPAIVEGKRN